MNVQPRIRYRPDIDGLRAIAVGLVVGYHAFPSLLRGGFIGVDIFFVISGFLISSIILEAVTRREFSFAEFYFRRIRRIFPALILVLASSLIIGWFLLYADEFRLLGSEVASSAGFVANITLWRDSGYFDWDASFKILLHIWSLSVEEQFYLVWPATLVVLAWRPKAWLPVVLAILSVSFIANVVLTPRDSQTAFYLPFTRLWELLSGAVASYWVQAPRLQVALQRLHVAKLRELAAWAGSLLIVGVVLVLDRSRPFPGWWALPPVVGSVLLIIAGPDALINRHLLSKRALVFIGLISYPIYLWHWPLLTFAHLTSWGAGSATTRLLIVVASVTLSWMTFVLVERPLRRTRSKGTTCVVLLFGLAAVGSAGWFISSHDGLLKRRINDTETFNLLERSFAQDDAIRGKYSLSEGACTWLDPTDKARQSCHVYGAANTKTWVVWGDSNVAAWNPMFFELADKEHARVVSFGRAGCPPLLHVRHNRGYGTGRPECASFERADAIAAVIASLHPERIFLIARWSMYVNGWTREGVLQPDPGFITEREDGSADAASSSDALRNGLMRTLQTLADVAPITVFRTPLPVLKTDIRRGLLRGLPMQVTAAEHAAYEATVNRAIDDVVRHFDRVEVFDPAASLCDETCVVSKNATLIYVDDAHVSAQGALLFEDVFVHRHDARPAR